MEVVNFKKYVKMAFEVCSDNNITIYGKSFNFKRWFHCILPSQKISFIKYHLRFFSKVWVKKTRHDQELTFKKNHNFCPILMKLGENNYLIRQSFTPTFMRVGHKMVEFLLMANFWVCLDFSTQTLPHREFWLWNGIGKTRLWKKYILMY